MATEVEPPELAALLDYAERPRAAGWSLRAALTRYAQPQPQRASDLIESMRRAEFGLRAHLKDVERNGPAVWAALHDAGGGDIDRHVVELLRVLQDLDRVGDVITAWAVDREGERPDREVAAAAAAASARLDDLGVPHEERPRPTGAARRG